MKLSEIITPVNCKFGAPMGRANIGKEPVTITRGRNCRICKADQVKVYDKHIPLIDGYDMGGTYWGLGRPLHVRFTKDLSFVQYCRLP